MSLVANARMYTVDPTSREAWRALLAWVGARAEAPLDYIDHLAPAPLPALWARTDLGAALMCGFPLAQSRLGQQIVAAPIPSPERYSGRAVYCSDLVVRADSTFTRLADTYGHRMGWTVEHSQSGYNALRHHLLDKPDAHFTWVGPLVTAPRVVEAVLNLEIDVGPLDSYVHEMIKRHKPETAARLRVVDSTAMTPAPMFVAARDADEAIVARLRAAFLAVEHEAAHLLEPLVLRGFAAPERPDYDELLMRAAAADAKFPVPQAVM